MRSRPNKPKHALILQGDWEAGLRNVAKDLIENGIKTTKTVLQPSDVIYKQTNIPTVEFDAPLSEFENWLRKYIKKAEVDCLILYNEFRPYNAIGYRVAEDLGIECLILELGLLRPDYITIYSREKNLFSYLAKRWSEIIQTNDLISQSKEPARLKEARTKTKIKQFAKAYVYSRFMTKIFRKFTHFKDQRTMSFRHHFDAGLKGILRFQGREKQTRYNRILEGKWSKKYYLVTLQVHCDSQITERSTYKSIEEFIIEVVNSFKTYAPEHTKLIFKIHPMDRGYADYAQLIRKLNTQFDKDRLLYLDRIQNPIALTNAIGCVMINSSMGISSLINGTPVKTLGEASFDLPELTYQHSLDSFWTEFEPVDPLRVQQFLSLLQQTSQGRGTFYQRMFAVRGHAKIQWPEEFSYLFGQNQ